LNISVIECQFIVVERVFFSSSAQDSDCLLAHTVSCLILQVALAKSKVAEASMFHAVIKVKGWSCTFLHMFSWHGA